MKLKTIALTAVLAVSALAHADDAKMKPDTADKAKPAKLTEAEMKVLAHQHMVNLMQVELGQHALKRGGSPAVKDYAKMLVADHQKADREIMAFAKKRGINKMPKETLTEEEKKTHAEATAQVAKLKKMKGAEMDRAFLQIVITDHDRELANLDMVMGEIQDPAMKQLLEDTRPMLQSHLDKARELQKLSEQTSSIEGEMNKDVN